MEENERHMQLYVYVQQTKRNFALLKLLLNCDSYTEPTVSSSFFFFFWFPRRHWVSPIQPQTNRTCVRTQSLVYVYGCVCLASCNKSRGANIFRFWGFFCICIPGLYVYCVCVCVWVRACLQFSVYGSCEQTIEHI